MAGVKGRSGGARPGAGRPRGVKNQATYEREAMFNRLARDVADLLKHAVEERQMRRHEFEAMPALLRRLTEIEKHLKMREEHRHPRSPRAYRETERAARPPTAAEALFKSGK